MCRQHAIAFFHAVPRRIVLDNLKAAITRSGAYARDEDPAVKQSYRECAEHYGFLIDPCLPRRPAHKGKVERGGVGRWRVKQSFLLPLEGEPTLLEANQQLRQWLLETAAQRVHGTTRAVPWERFTQTEWPALLPEPAPDYDPSVWKQVQLHRDVHVIFERAYYSAPHRNVRQTLWLRAGLREVRLFTEQFELIASHPRAKTHGERFTQPDHLSAHLAAALDMERMLQTAASERGLPVVILRCGLFYSHDSAQTRRLLEVVRRGLMPIIGSGDAYWSTIKAEDAAGAVAAVVALPDKAAGGVFNVVDDEPARYRDVLSHLAQTLIAVSPARRSGAVAAYDAALC